MVDMKEVIKRVKQFFGFWEIIVAAFILATVSWYLSEIFDNRIIFALSAITISVLAGYVLSVSEKEKQKKSANELSTLLHAMDKVKEDLVESNNDNRQQVVQEFDSRLAAICEKMDVTESNLGSALARNEKARQEDALKLDASLKSLDESFSNAVEAYQEMESRMVALELQNVHLQLLTTMMSTVRSDVAQLNEVKGFVEEHKMGRKVRIIRDDEHGIIVENLMNSDGVGIEKSKMFKGKRLAFEASFDAAGKMLSSLSYDENGNPSTEITYYSETMGGPTLRDLAKDGKDRFVSFLNKMGVYPRR